ncbi:MAG: GGDEF domain-containing protein [Fusobacteriaceae bacterium]|nr:GGDEF domain-containing protein [Fusobacteriaceae bacterium]
MEKAKKIILEKFEKDKRKLLVYSLFLYVFFVLLFFINEYTRSKEAILKHVDSRLKGASISLNYIVPNYIQDLARNDIRITPKEEIEYNNLLSKMAIEHEVKYIYSFIKKDGKVYYTFASYTEEDLKNNDIYSYLIEYKEATPELIALFSEPNKEIFEVSQDDYGYFRSHLKSYVSDNGHIYVVGADMEVKDINKLYLKSFIKAFAISLFLLISVFPIFFFYKKILNLEIINNINRKKLEKLEIDDITGLPYIEKFWAENQNIEYPSIFLIGINNLKVLNDHYGDETSDKILKHISDVLLNIQEMGLNGKVFKVGLDEYAIIFDDEKDKEDIYITGEYILESIYNTPLIDKEDNIIITLIIGAATGKDLKEEDINIKLKRVFLEARMSLNYAYEKKLRIFVFDNLQLSDMSSADDEILWTNKISEAIRNKKIVPYFQPIFNIKENTIEKYESLMRMITTDEKVLTPYYFLSMSQKIGLYFKLTGSMIYSTFEFFVNKNIEFSINISASDILDETTRKLILNNVKNFYNPKYIVFEILESEGINNFSEIICFIKAVKELGCKIAIDDFGSGYSNFERLSKLEIDYVKIDGSLIKNIDKDKNSQILVQMIVGFARELGIKTIAEFVHSEDVFNKVKELGVDYAQGYYIGEPKPHLIDFKL